MSYTPVEIRHVRFRRSAVGYRRASVDHILAERALALPGPWKLDRGVPKPLLVEPLRSSLPEQIVHRRKRGFTLPWEHWLRDELRLEVEQTLTRTAEGPLGSLLNQAAVQQVWDDFERRRTSWSRPWSIYVLQRWCERNSISA